MVTRSRNHLRYLTDLTELVEAMPHPSDDLVARVVRHQMFGGCPHCYREQRRRVCPRAEIAFCRAFETRLESIGTWMGDVEFIARTDESPLYTLYRFLDTKKFLTRHYASQHEDSPPPAA